MTKARKGFIGDIFLYIIILFSMAIVLIAIGLVWSKLSDSFGSDANIPQEAKDIINLQATKFPKIWDGWAVLAVIGYIIAIVITAMNIRSHPVFAIFALILLIVLGVVSVYLSNTYRTFITSTADLSSVADDFTMYNFIMDKLPYIIVSLGIVFIIILYAKTRQQAFMI
ncbi:MAG TPA: hypothetical protein ENI36_01480 [Thermoplasmatales archaeon]|nr:hypothetical protein [Thermoplasmatales archaeon]